MNKIIGSRFGSLNPSTYRTYWSGDLKLDDKTIGVTIEFEDARRVPEKIPLKFEQFFVTMPIKDAAFRAAAAENLLELYNGTWSEDDEPLSAKEFADRIKLDAISFREGEETVEVYYDDNDLFAGHAIKVVANYDGTIRSASLP